MRRKLVAAGLIVVALVVLLWVARNVTDLVGFIKRLHGG
jgi:hypothetical protein